MLYESIYLWAYPSFGKKFFQKKKKKSIEPGGPYTLSGLDFFTQRTEGASQIKFLVRGGVRASGLDSGGRAYYLKQRVPSGLFKSNR